MLKSIQFFSQLALIMIFWGLGVGIQHVFELKITGNIIGLLLLVCFLLTGFLKLQSVEIAGKLLLQHLVLFFIPCVVGLIQFQDLFVSYGFQMIITVVLSTICVLVVTAYSVYWGFKLQHHLTKDHT